MKKIWMMEMTTDTDYDYIIGKYKNLIFTKEIQLHEGHYAINIKAHHAYPHYLNEDDGNFAIEYLQHSFFDLVDIVCKGFGYAGFSVEGRSGGWLKPIQESINHFKPITAPTTMNLDFYEYIIQEKFLGFSNIIKDLQDKFEIILKYSKDTQQIINQVTRIIENGN